MAGMDRQPQPRKKTEPKGFNPGFVGDENLKAKAETQDQQGMTGMHMDNLYDMDEDVFGQKVNEATGKKIDNSTGGSHDESMFHEIEGGGTSKSGDIMGDVKDEEDAASKWLRENDPDKNTRH